MPDQLAANEVSAPGALTSFAANYAESHPDGPITHSDHAAQEALETRQIDRPLRPARPQAGHSRYPRAAAIPRRQAGDGDRRWRVDRLRDLPPDHEVLPRPAATAGAGGERAIRNRP